MKKLTAGIFATLLTMVSVDGAYAAIASKGYVDDKVGEVSQTVTTLSGTVGGHTTSIGEIQGKMATYGDIVTHNSAEYATAAQGALADTAVQPAAISDMQVKANLTTNAEWNTEKAADDKYPSNAAVDAAIKSATSGLPTSGKITEIEGDITTIEGNITDIQGDVTELQTDVSAKQDKNMGAAAANHIVTTDGTGNITSSATIANTQVSGLGTLATKSTVTSADITDGTIAEDDLNASINASLDKADTALQRADLDDYVTKEAADAAYAANTLEDQVGTVSKENMGTTNATTVVGGVKEAIDAAKAADTKAGQAATAASTAQSEVDALEDVVNNEATGLAAAHTAIDAVEGRVTTAEGEIDAIQAEMDTMATSETVTNLTNRVTTAEGDITVLETAVNDAESGLAATNAIADSALSTAQSAQTTANAALPKATYDSQVGTVTAGNMGTTATTVVAAIKEAVNEAAAAQDAANTAQATADGAIPAPDGECAEPANKCVLTYNNTVYAWEVIERGTAE